MRRFWDSGQDEGDIEARLRAERPEPSNELVDRITVQLADGQRRRELGKARKAVAVVFARAKASRMVCRFDCVASVMRGPRSSLAVSADSTHHRRRRAPTGT